MIDYLEIEYSQNHTSDLEEMTGDTDKVEVCDILWGNNYHNIVDINM